VILDNMIANMASSSQPARRSLGEGESTKADSHDLIRVEGARENNLKDVSVQIPKRRLTVFTGVSGSGKSSLVFGTIAAVSIWRHSSPVILRSLGRDEQTSTACNCRAECCGTSESSNGVVPNYRRNGI
jgi:hypothetical protein